MCFQEYSFLPLGLGLIFLKTLPRWDSPPRSGFLFLKALFSRFLQRSYRSLPQADNVPPLETKGCKKFPGETPSFRPAAKFCPFARLTSLYVSRFPWLAHPLLSQVVSKVLWMFLPPVFEISSFWETFLPDSFIHPAKWSLSFVSSRGASFVYPGPPFPDRSGDFDPCLSSPLHHVRNDPPCPLRLPGRFFGSDRRTFSFSLFSFHGFRAFPPLRRHDFRMLFRSPRFRGTRSFLFFGSRSCLFPVLFCIYTCSTELFF